MVKSNSRQGKHREYENLEKNTGNTQGISKFFDRKLKSKYAQKKLLRDVGFIFDV